jgi:hypothetical protein
MTSIVKGHITQTSTPLAKQSHCYLFYPPPNILLKKTHLLVTPRNSNSYPPPFLQFLVIVHQDIHANISTPHKLQPIKNKEIEQAMLHISAHYLHTNKSMWKIITTFNTLLASHHQLPRMCCFCFWQLMTLLHLL